MEKLEIPRRAWPSEACRVFSVSARLKITRIESASSKLWTRHGQKTRYLHVERQPALIASDTYHLRRHRRIDHHFVLVNDFSSGLEGLYAHWLQTELVTRILKKTGGQCQLIRIKRRRRNSTWVASSKETLRALRLSLTEGQTASKRR